MAVAAVLSAAITTADSGWPQSGTGAGRMVSAPTRPHDGSHMDTTRATGLTLTVGAAAVVGAVVTIAAVELLAKSVPWLVANVVFLGAAAVVWRRRPASRAALWFAAVAAGFGVTQLLDGLVRMVGADVLDVGDALPWLVLLHQVGVAVSSIVTAHFIGRFPDGRVVFGRRTLSALWLLLVAPLLALVATPTLVVPPYLELPTTTNPFQVAALAPLGDVATALVLSTQGAFAVGVAVLVVRYRRAEEAVRQRIRWLIVPVLVAVFAVSIDLAAVAVAPGTTPTWAVVIGGVLWITALVALPTSVTIALTRPRLVDVDLLLRRSLVYGVLWLLIGAVYVGAATALGVAAGQRLPVEVAIGLTVVASLAFQPARRRLERAADRWVFGERLGRYEALRRLGQELEDSHDHGDVLERLADTVQRGLRLPWVRVTAEGPDGTTSLAAVAGTPPATAHEPVAVVPIVDAGETVGRIACGGASDRPLADEDRELVEALARRAGLAVRTLRLNRELEDNVVALRQRTAELEESRTRLVRVQEEERRRLERDLHDGVQQDVVALMGRVGLARRRVDRGEDDGAVALAEVQAELGRILGVLRELARGIHPTVLTDRGLVEAVQAQAARSPVPVHVVADDAVRTERYGSDVEGAAFFTVCEALTNVLKHAQPSEAEVRIVRRNGTLEVCVEDAGPGFDETTVTPGGLRNLAERVEALGGRLSVSTSPGQGTIVTAELAVEGVDHGG